MNSVNSQTFFNFLSFSKVYIALRKIQKLKKCPKVGRIDPEGGAAAVLEACAIFYKRKLNFTVLAQFAHFSKLRKKRKHCANAISLQKNMPKAKLQLLTDLLDELCQFSDIFPFFAIFLSV